ncbi:MAG: tetratricopeptide repeat protein [Thermodesulfobacterium sp.]|nr:tetratricopeptide repeat protein [Thermodesulfobacterium sp.]
MITEEALKILEKEAIENPNSVFAQHRLAIAYFNLGKFQEAKEAFKKVLKLDPFHFEAMINLGILLAQEGNLEEAKKAFTFTLKYYPKSLEAWNNLGLIEFELGNLDEAEKCYKKALEIDETFTEAWINLSTVLIEKELFEEAISALEKAKTYAPEAGIIYNNLAVAYYYLKDKESAIKNINLAKEKGYPVNPEFESMVNETL